MILNLQEYIKIIKIKNKKPLVLLNKKHSSHNTKKKKKPFYCVLFLSRVWERS
jgi:hypothetical protein